MVPTGVSMTLRSSSEIPARLQVRLFADHAVATSLFTFPFASGDDPVAGQQARRNLPLVAKW